MGINYTALASELTAGHPTTGAYSLTDATAAAELNAVNRPADGGIAAMVRYLATHDNRTNEGGDTNATLMLGRLMLVAGSEPYTDPFHRAGVWEAGGSGTNEQIQLDATNNKLVFGTAHSLTTLDAKDAIRLSGSSADDGVQQIVSITSQDVVVPSITVDETLERVFRVFKVQDAKNLTNEQIQNAKGILGLLTAPAVTIVDFTDTEINLAFSDMETAGVWKSADTTALKALSQNQQSRAQEISDTLNYSGVITESHVAEARS